MQTHATQLQESEGIKTLCFNCEEYVDERAPRCPYCRADLLPSVQNYGNEEKITSLPLNKNRKTSSETSEKTVANRGPLGFSKLIFSLFFLLTGSTLFFLSIMIALFSKDGFFVLSWQEQSWSAFFGLGTALISFGFIFFQNPVSKED